MEFFLGYGNDDKMFYVMEPLGGQSLSPIRRNYENNPSIGDGLRNLLVKRDARLQNFRPFYFAWQLPSNKMEVKEKDARFNLQDEGTFIERIGGRKDKEIYSYEFNPSNYDGNVESSVAYIFDKLHGIYGWLPNAVLIPPISVVTGDKLNVENECKPCPCKYIKPDYPAIEIFEVVDGGCIVQTSVPLVHISNSPELDLETVHYTMAIKFSAGNKYNPHHPLNNPAVRNPFSLGYMYNPQYSYIVTLNNYFDEWEGGKLGLISVRLNLNGVFYYPSQIVHQLNVGYPEVLFMNYDFEDVVCEKFYEDSGFVLTSLSGAKASLGLQFSVPLNKIEGANIPIISGGEYYPYNKIIINPADCLNTKYGPVCYNFRLVTSCCSPLTYAPESEEEVVLYPPPSAFRPAGIGIRMEDKKCPLLTLEQRNETISKPYDTEMDSSRLEYFCDSSIESDSIDTDYWVGDKEVVDTHGVRINAPFWEGYNHILRDLSNYNPIHVSNIVNITEFYKYLYKLLTDTKSGEVIPSLEGTWQEFLSDPGIGCLSNVQLASVFMTYRLKVPALIFASASGYLNSNILDVMLEYIGRTPAFVYEWVNFNDCEPDPGVGAYNQDYIDLRFTTYINCEPNGLIPRMPFSLTSAFKPHDYRILDLDNWFMVSTPSAEGMPDSHTGFISPDISGVSSLAPYCSAEIIVHEIGHAVDAYGFNKYGFYFSQSAQWMSIAGWEAGLPYDTSRALINKVEFGSVLPGELEAPVSAYGCTHPLEDFAEAYRIYKLNPYYLKNIYPKRFNFMEAHIKNLTP